MPKYAVFWDFLNQTESLKANFEPFWPPFDRTGRNLLRHSPISNVEHALETLRIYEILQSNFLSS